MNWTSVADFLSYRLTRQQYLPRSVWMGSEFSDDILNGHVREMKWRERWRTSQLNCSWLIPKKPASNVSNLYEAGLSLNLFSIFLMSFVCRGRIENVYTVIFAWQYILNIFQISVECFLSINLKPPQYFMSGPICFDFWYLQRLDLAIICCNGIWRWHRARQPPSGSVSTDPWHQEPLLSHDDQCDPSCLLSSSSSGLSWAWAAHPASCSWPQSFLFVGLPVSETFLSSISGRELCSGNSVSAKNAS